VFSVDGTIPNLAATVTHVSLLAYALAGVFILSSIKNALFFGLLVMMKNESQLEIKIKLFASSIHSRFIVIYKIAELEVTYNLLNKSFITTQAWQW
jgi:hypothetical protein